MTNGLFDTPAAVEDQIPEEIKPEEFIGEGKRWSDPAVVIKGKLEADRHIKQLEADLAELRDELKQRTTLDEIKDLMSRGNQPTPARDIPERREDPVEPKPMTSQELDALFDKKRQEWTKQEMADRNAAIVTTQLKEVFGPNFGAKVEEKANALGVGKQFLEDMARTQPKAFLKLMDAEGKPQPRRASDPEVFTAPPASERATSFAPVVEDRTHSYWQKMQKSNKALYYSREMTAKRHADARRLGEAFFDTQ